MPHLNINCHDYYIIFVTNIKSNIANLTSAECFFARTFDVPS